jgi:hypothetical protein
VKNILQPGKSRISERRKNLKAKTKRTEREPNGPCVPDDITFNLLSISSSLFPVDFIENPSKVSERPSIWKPPVRKTNDKR